MKWFIVLMFSQMMADGTVEVEERVLNIMYTSEEDCQIMAPTVATDYFNKILEKTKSQAIMITYRCDMEKMVEEAVWKKFKL